MLIFVYGTLKSGERNNLYFLGNQTLMGQARTENGFRLYDLGQFPAMVEDHTAGSVCGELWDVNERCLLELDRLEGLDKGLYERKVIQLKWPKLEAQAYLCLFNVEGLVDCGEWWGKSLYKEASGTIMSPDSNMEE
jgi:gamma-glutamylcyclotransferase (GGCT)/AIG2-like uncharacterized protein YtfP